MAEYTQTKFDSKSFNPVAFGAYVNRIPATKRTELIKSRALKGDEEIRNAFSSQTGTAFATLPMLGRIGGTPLNYDGKTDITAQSTTTFERGVVVIGRAQAWTESDFSADVTGGVDFMDNAASQIGEYWDGVDQDTLLHILKGIFGMTGTDNLNFVNGHTLDITGAPGADKEGNPLNCAGPATLNSAIQKASGDNKSTFTIAVMHSAVSTNLENMRLLAYLKYTDANGVQRDLGIATWNGRSVLIDDSMPTAKLAAGYVSAVASTADALKCTTAGTGVGEVKLSDVQTTLPTAKENDFVVFLAAGEQYTTYVLGDGAFSYENIGAKVPYEMARDPKTNGGKDTLYSRQRKVFAPFGISYTKKAQATLSPTDAELENGQNWALVHDGDSANKKCIDHKSIPIAKILSRG